MKKIAFVCLGNICRSPMAEFVMKSLTDQVYIESRATSNWEHGNPIHHGTRGIFKKHHISHHARIVYLSGNKQIKGPCGPLKFEPTRWYSSIFLRPPPLALLNTSELSKDWSGSNVLPKPPMRHQMSSAGDRSMFFEVNARHSSP